MFLIGVFILFIFNIIIGMAEFGLPFCYLFPLNSSIMWSFFSSSLAFFRLNKYFLEFHLNLALHLNIFSLVVAEHNVNTC